MPEYVYRGRTNEGEHVFGSIESPSVREAFQELKSSHGIVLVTGLEDRSKASGYRMERLEKLKQRVGKIFERFGGPVLKERLKSISGREKAAAKTTEEQAEKEKPGWFSNMLESRREAAREKRALKILELVKKLNETNVTIGSSASLSSPDDRVIFDIFVQQQDDLPQPVEPKRPEFKKKPQRRQSISDGHAIPWDKIKGPSQGIKKVKVSLKDILLFTRRFALLLSSGISISNALYALSQHTPNEKLRNIVQTIYRDIQGGNPLSYALLRFPNQFSPLYVAMVVVGEKSGTLDTCLLDMADFLEIQQKINQTIKSVTIYPRIVFVVLALLMVASAKFFIPMFSELFNDVGMELPFLTRAIFWFADMLLYLIPAVAFFLAGIFLLLRTAKKLGEEYLYQKDKLALRFPVIKGLTMATSMFYFSHTLAIMLKNGVRLIDSLTMARDVVPNRVLQEEVHDAIEQVVEGSNLSDALFNEPHFDPIMANMI